MLALRGAGTDRRDTGKLRNGSWSLLVDWSLPLSNAAPRLAGVKSDSRALGCHFWAITSLGRWEFGACGLRPSATAQLEAPAACLHVTAQLEGSFKHS